MGKITLIGDTLDHSRIEKIIDLIKEKANDFRWGRNQLIDKKTDELKEEAIKHFDLTPHFDAIESYDKEIEALKEQIEEINNKKDVHKVEIAKVLRGNENTYNYNKLEVDSPAGKYVYEKMPNSKKISSEMEKLIEDIEVKLWLAKDIEEARQLFEYAMNRISEVTTFTREELGR